MSKAVYAVIRGGSLEGALNRFRGQFGRDPVAVIVNAGLVEQAIEAVEVIGLDAPVVANGGCLFGEWWLERPAVDVQAAAETARSLTARVAAAQRAADPMTPERARQLALLALEVER